MLSKRCFLLASSISSIFCSISFFPEPGSPMLMKQNARRYFLASFSTEGSIVAEKRCVTLNSYWPDLANRSYCSAMVSSIDFNCVVMESRMKLTSASNPISIILSASSNTAHEHWSRTKNFFNRDSLIRPGVPIRTSIPRFRWKACSSSRRPPTTTNERRWVPTANLENSSSI